MVGLVVLAFIVPLAPYSARADDVVARVPDRRGGDVLDIFTNDSVTFPWLGSSTTQNSSFEETITWEPGTLRYQFGEEHYVVWSNRTVRVSGVDFFEHAANDLATGDSLYSPRVLGTCPPCAATMNILDLLMASDSLNESFDFVRLSPGPAHSLHDLVGDGPLGLGSVVEGTFDARPRFDFIEHQRLEIQGVDTVRDQITLRGDLATTRTVDGVTHPTSHATVWIADGVPEPVRIRVDETAGDVAYRLDREVVAFTPGNATLVRPAYDGAPYPSAPARPFERGAFGRNGPSDGSSALLLPLSEAAALARVAPPDANAAAFFLTHADSIVTAGVYETAATELGATATWALYFESPDGSYAEVAATRQAIAALPGVAVDRTEGTSAFWPGMSGVRATDLGHEVLTMGGMENAADAQRTLPIRSSFAWVAWHPSGGELGIYFESVQKREDVSGSASNGEDRFEMQADQFQPDGGDRYRLYDAGDMTTTFRVGGVPVDLPIMPPFPVVRV